MRAALGLGVLTFAELVSLFRHCPVHGLELQAESLPVAYGTFAPVPRSELEAVTCQYPLANTRAYGLCWGGEATHRKALFCPDCRAVLRDRQASRDAPT